MSSSGPDKSRSSNEGGCRVAWGWLMPTLGLFPWVGFYFLLLISLVTLCTLLRYFPGHSDCPGKTTGIIFIIQSHWTVLRVVPDLVGLLLIKFWLWGTPLNCFGFLLLLVGKWHEMVAPHDCPQRVCRTPQEDMALQLFGSVTHLDLLKGIWCLQKRASSHVLYVGWWWEQRKWWTSDFLVSWKT